MSFRNTLSVAILFVTLGAYLYFVESEKMREEAKPDRLLDGLSLEQVAGITLEYPDRKIVLRKTGDGWRIQEPRDLRADQTAAENLARAVVDAELKRTIDEEVGTPEAYGLDEPKVVVRLERKDGDPVPAVRVGRNAPVGYSTFVQLEGQSSVRLVPSSFSSGMERKVEDLRDKEILAFETDDVTRIEVATGDEGADFTLAREGDTWKIVEPAARATDDAEVRTFLSSLRSLRAQSFFDEPEDRGAFGLDSPRRKITIRTGEDEPAKTLLVGSEGTDDKEKSLYVQAEGVETVYGVGAYAWANLKKTAGTFRDKTVLAFDGEKAGALEVTRADGEAFRVVRAAGAEGQEDAATETDAGGSAQSAEETEADEGAGRWVVEGAGSTSNETAAAQLVGDVQALEGFETAAEDPDDLSPFGLVTPALTIAVLDREGAPIGRILVSQTGPEGERKSYAMAEGGDTVFRIRDYVYAHLDKKRVDLVEAPPATGPAAESTQATPSTESTPTAPDTAAASDPPPAREVAPAPGEPSPSADDAQ